MDRYRAAQQAYRAQALLKDQLNDRLKVNGSVSGFAKGLKEMASTDGEGVLRRLSGKGDAHLLGFLGENFPRTAQAIKDYHVNDLIQTGVSKAKAGEKISIPALQRAVEGMSPELRDFVVPKEALPKLEGMGVLQDRLNQVPHNFSNTARTNAVLNKYGVGTATGMVSLLTGHGAAASIVAGEVAHTLSKAAPDAARLALLKFLGSKEPINGVALKGVANFIQSASRGENLLLNATKGFFKAGSQIIPNSMVPNADSREKLEKSLQFASEPQNAATIGNNLGHYLPSHATAASALTANAVNYLNSLKPTQPQNSPLDKPAPVDKYKQAIYDRALDLAEQPLLAIKLAKEGKLQAQDLQTLNTLYPNLHSKMVSQLYDQMVKAKAEGKAIPYSERLGLSRLMGTPLDSTMTQPAMASIMMANAPKVGNTQPGFSQKKPSQATASSMQKADKMYATPQQSRSAARTTGS